jgi:hypothetical protein
MELEQAFEPQVNGQTGNNEQEEQEVTTQPAALATTEERSVYEPQELVVEKSPAIEAREDVAVEVGSSATPNMDNEPTPELPIVEPEIEELIVVADAVPEPSAELVFAEDAVAPAIDVVAEVLPVADSAPTEPTQEVVEDDTSVAEVSEIAANSEMEIESPIVAKSELVAVTAAPAAHHNQEQASPPVADLMEWWQNTSFAGKDSFTVEEGGQLKLRANQFLKERVMSSLSPENCVFVLRNLTERFSEVQSKINELEVEWLAAEDKLKVADKIYHLKDFLQHINAVGDFAKAVELVASWESTINLLIDDNLKTKTKLAELAESFVGTTLWKDGSAALKEINEQWKKAGYVDKSRNDALWNRIEAARKTFHDSRRTYHEDEEKVLLRALDLKIELAENAEALAESEEWKATSEKFQQIIDTWKTIGRTLPKKNEELWQRIMTAKNAFFNRKKVHFTHIQEEQLVNLEKKLLLVERAEAMKDNTDWGTTAQAYGQLMEEWKGIGRIPQERTEELWRKFIGAHEHFFEAKRQHTEKMRLELDNNLNLKRMLLNRAEEVKNSSRWGEATAEMNQLFEEWRKIGPLPRDQGKKMWEAFIAARKHFFNRKDANRTQRKTFAETKKSARSQQAQEHVFMVEREIEAEEERLKDLQNALDNVTPGKKADELTAHLNVLISDSNAKMKRLREKLKAVQDELEDMMEKEKKAQEKKQAE